MAYLSFTTGTPIAIINGGPLDNEIVHLFDPDINKPPKRPEQQLKSLNLPEGKVFPLPSETSEQLYISGPNGSGKTYYTAQWLKLMRGIYPKKKIYIISDLEEDPLLDNVHGGVYRVELSDDLIEDPLTPEDFRNSIVVFDDIDSIANKKIMQAVTTLRDSLLKTSRHTNTYVIATNHMSADYKNTRTLINECRSLTFFPKSGSTNQITRVLKDYCGLNTKQIDMIFSLPSRWVTLHKNYPMYITYERGIILL